MRLVRRLAARFPLLLLARRNLSRATARSALAVLAVVIGVVAIGAIGTGGEAFKQDQLDAYEGFGGTATVDPVFRPDDQESDRTFSAAEIDRMRATTDGAAIIPVVRPPGGLVRTAAGETLITAQVKGLGSPDAFYAAAEGEIPENPRRTVLVGSRLADANGIRPGDRLTVRVAGGPDRSFRVAAVLEPQGFADPLNADRSVFLPPDTFDDPSFDRAVVRVDPRTGSIDAAARAIESTFNSRERTVEVDPVRQQREQTASFLRTINQFLVGVGAVSLLVAAATIANTMLMSAIEREAEIGLLRAVGYPKTAVVRLLVAEATLIGAVGAVVGAPLALAIGMAANEALLGDPLAFTATGLWYVVAGVAFGVATALVAGLYPAWTAADERPVEVLD